MPATLTYPGVYVEEIPSGVRTIMGVATSVTAFVGAAPRGPVDEPVVLNSFADFQRTFGDLWDRSLLGYSVQQFFLNGGSQAVVVRVASAKAGDAAQKATATLSGGVGLQLEAENPGAWANSLKVSVDHDTSKPDDPKLFNLTVLDSQSKASETYRNLSTDPAAVRFVTRVLAQESTLVRVVKDTAVPETRPDAGPDGGQAMSGGQDGAEVSPSELQGNEADKTGIYALLKTDIFNLLVIPPVNRSSDHASDATSTLLQSASKLCLDRRAILLVDAPNQWARPSQAVAGLPDVIAKVGDAAKNAAVYYPRLRMPDPLRQGQIDAFPPSGAVAGIIARTDAQRGIWKAPAGLEASVGGVRELAVKLTDMEQGMLNPLGLNCLRNFGIAGNVVWGARTMRGADRLADEWKYLPIRRLALHIEESLYRGTQWVVFEPNDEPLWSQIRLNVGAFMHDLFRKGAFQGSSPGEAYLVKCDKETTPQSDIDKGIVNILVGFAPLKPAEFVVLKIQQLAGQKA